MVSDRQYLILRVTFVFGLFAGAMSSIQNTVLGAIWGALFLTLPVYALMARYNGEKMFPRIRRRLHNQIEELT